MSAKRHGLEDVHDSSFEERVIAVADREVREFSNRSDEFIESGCPACGSNARGTEIECKGFRHQPCLDCGTVYISPCPPEHLILDFLNASEGYRMWRDEMPAATRASRLRMYAERADYVVAAADRFKAARHLLVEVGAGNGEFAHEITSRSAFQRMVLAEPQPIDISLPNVTVAGKTFEDLDLERNADVLVAFEVFEHLVDPTQFLAMARRCLRPNGLLIMSMPNITGLELAVLGAGSHSFPFDHVRLYNPTSLELVLKRNGFETLQIETPGRFDVELIRRAYENGTVDLAGDPALRFVVSGSEELREEFQGFLQTNLLSSHMRCIARTLE
jgi:SAM-dependent methyltransferase